MGTGKGGGRGAGNENRCNYGPAYDARPAVFQGAVIHAACSWWPVQTSRRGLTSMDEEEETENCPLRVSGERIKIT